MQNKGNVIQKEYDLRFSESQNYRINVWKILCNNYFNKFIRSNDSVLELGPGWGEFINNINAQEKFAIDINPQTVSKLEKEVYFYQQDASLDWNIPSESIDVIFSSNFLEHLEDKMRIERIIKEAYRVLRNNGRILLLGPNIKFVKGEYWDFWDHYIPLTDVSLTELLNINGFDVKESIPRFLPYSMSTGFQPNLIFVKLYLRFPFLWRIFGKQFFIVGEKAEH